MHFDSTTGLIRRTAPRNAVPTPSAGGTPFGTGANSVGSLPSFTVRQLHQMRPYDRREAIKTSRYGDNNLAIWGAINDKSIDYAVGEGIFGYAASGDEDYNDSANRFLDSVFESVDFDVCGEQNLYEMTWLVGRHMLVDGDCGFAKILPREAKSGRILGKPQIQLFAGDQIGDPHVQTPGTAADGWQEGVLRDSVGKALRYRVLREDLRFATGIQGKKPWDYLARDFGLVLDRKRIQLNRGIPWCHRAAKNGLSMMDLAALEEVAAYVNAVFAAIITTPDGQTPEAVEQAIVSSYAQTTTTSDPEGTETTRAVQQKFVELFGGGKIPVLPQGSKIEAYQGKTDSTMFNGFLDYLVAQLAHSYGVPPTFLWAMVRGTGPEVRMVLSQAAWYFRRIQTILQRRFLEPLRNWVLDYGLLTGQINGGRLPIDGSPYRAVRWRTPKDITIDERYYHRTWLDRLESGKGTEEEYYGAQGKEWRDEQKQRVIEVKHLMELCDEEGVDYDRVVGRKPGSFNPSETAPSTSTSAKPSVKV